MEVDGHNCLHPPHLHAEQAEKGKAEEGLVSLSQEWQGVGEGREERWTYSVNFTETHRHFCLALLLFHFSKNCFYTVPILLPLFLLVSGPVS